MLPLQKSYGTPHPLAAQFLQVYPLLGKVELLEPEAFAILTNELNFKPNQSAQQAAREAAAEPSFPK